MQNTIETIVAFKAVNGEKEKKIVISCLWKKKHSLHIAYELSKTEQNSNNKKKIKLAFEQRYFYCFLLNVQNDIMFSNRLSRLPTFFHFVFRNNRGARLGIFCSRFPMKTPVIACAAPQFFTVLKYAKKTRLEGQRCAISIRDARFQNCQELINNQRFC